MHATRPRTQAVFAAVAIVILYLCLFHELDAVGLIGPDEPRYAAIAQAMAESGDWVTPRLHGEAWFEKPVLYYWAAAGAFRLFGVSETSARLPSALAALLLTLAMAWIVRRLYGWEAAWMAVFIFPTTVAAIGFARAATTDMLFSTALGFAMLIAVWLHCNGRSDTNADNMEGPGVRSGRLWLAAFGACLGLAALAKGPVAIVLAGGSVGLWALVTRRWRTALRLAHPVVILTFCVVALPWYLLCAARNPEFVDVFLLSHNVERFLTPVFRHEQPFWFFGPILLLGLAPWTALLAFPVLRARGGRLAERWQSSTGVFLACWVVFPMLFFSASKSKLPGYILPVIASLVILFARGLAAEEPQAPRTARWPLATVGLTWIALAISSRHWLGRLPSGSGMEGAQSAHIWIAGAATVGGLIAAMAIKGKLRAAIVVSSLLMAVLVAATTTQFLPTLDAHLSPRELARTVQAEANAEQVRVFELHRAWHYGLNFYLRRDVPRWAPGQAPPPLLVTSEAGLRQLNGQGVAVSETRRISQQAVLVRVASD